MSTRNRRRDDLVGPRLAGQVATVAVSVGFFAGAIAVGQCAPKWCALVAAFVFVALICVALPVAVVGLPDITKPLDDGKWRP